MPQHDEHNYIYKNKKWVIETFLPLLTCLNVDNVPASSDIPNIIYLSEHRDYIIKGMGNCVLSISQDSLPPEAGGGMLLVNHRNINGIDIFKLNILIDSKLCNKNNRKSRLFLKIACVHEFTHVIATLSAISRVKTPKLIISLMKQIRDKKALPKYIPAIFQLNYMLRDINRPLIKILHSIQNGIPIDCNFNSSHYRLGFEDIQASYPKIFEGLLLPNEIFIKYFSSNEIEIIKNSIKTNKTIPNSIIMNIFRKIKTDEALTMNLIKNNFCLNFLPSIMD